jgi:hypothetical protein
VISPGFKISFFKWVNLYRYTSEGLIYSPFDNPAHIRALQPEEPRRYVHVPLRPDRPVVANAGGRFTERWTEDGERLLTGLKVDARFVPQRFRVGARVDCRVPEGAGFWVRGTVGLSVQVESSCHP